MQIVPLHLDGGSAQPYDRYPKALTNCEPIRRLMLVMNLLRSRSASVELLSIVFLLRAGFPWPELPTTFAKQAIPVGEAH